MHTGNVMLEPTMSFHCGIRSTRQDVVKGPRLVRMWGWYVLSTVESAIADDWRCETVDYLYFQFSINMLAVPCIKYNWVEFTFSPSTDTCYLLENILNSNI